MPSTLHTADRRPQAAVPSSIQQQGLELPAAGQRRQQLGHAGKQHREVAPSLQPAGQAQALDLGAVDKGHGRRRPRSVHLFSPEIGHPGMPCLRMDCSLKKAINELRQFRK
jgi:hypothetical protein